MTFNELILSTYSLKQQDPIEGKQIYHLIQNGGFRLTFLDRFCFLHFLLDGIVLGFGALCIGSSGSSIALILIQTAATAAGEHDPLGHS